ncbi:hypothetical protein ABR738_00570 [Streptomyces sp. Edi4]|uniref:hypothetical protein n=1 Tax=Streptomyces sp. Edi4 TaxID=3162527 RepID=UPI003306567B
MTPDQRPSVYDAARENGHAALRTLLGAHVAPTIADAITNAALQAGLEMLAANRITDPGSAGYGEPVHWLVYNAMHERALRAEHALEAALRNTAAQTGADGGAQ